MNGILEIYFSSPSGEMHTHKVIPINWRDWQENGLYPLPVNHDSPFDLDVQGFTSDMLKKRHAYLRELSDTVYVLLAQAILAQDPIRGYPKEEK